MSIFPQPRPSMGYRLLLAYENWALTSVGATATAPGSESPNFSIDKALSEEMDVAFRSSSLAAFPGDILTVRINLGQARSVDWISLEGHNVMVPIRARVYRGNPISAPVIHQTPWLDPVVRARLSDFDYFTCPWTLGPSQHQLAAWQRAARLSSPIALPEVFRAIQWVEIDFAVSEVARVGHVSDFLEIALFRVAQAFRPAVNASLGWQIYYNDRTVRVESDGGAQMGRRRYTGRSVAFTLGHLEQDEAFRNILTEMSRDRGTLARVFLWMEPHKPRYFYDQALTGVLGELPKIAMSKLEWPSASGLLVTETA